MQRHHVSAGNQFIGRAQPLTLEAYLGTCVGVALVDAAAGIGGLAHFLLPEPVAQGCLHQAEKYASSGMPLFLRALYDAGAQRQDLRATIAGGALIGPVYDLDISLDIGGRTAEIADRILASEGIPVVKRETGGLNACCLSLNMQQWGCRIEPCGIAPEGISSSATLPGPQDIQRAVDQIKPVPQAALKIMRLIEEEEYDTRSLAAELRQDQVLSARTLKLANSVMFGSRSRIDSIDHALMFLGVNQLLKFVIAAAVETFYAQSESGYSLCKGGIYHHAIGTAVVAEKLAQITAASRPGLSYAAGLLHDIGKVVLDQFVASAFPFFYRQLAEAQTTDFTQAEQKLFGITHTEVGYSLAQNWHFPESLAEAIRYHHSPEQGKRHSELNHIVFLADLIMTQFHSGLELERKNPGDLAQRLAALGLAPGQLPQIVDAMPSTLFSASPQAAITG